MLAEQLKIDYGGTVTYIGVSACGASETAPVWKITKINHDATGKVLSIQHSGGTIHQIYKWSDRLGVEYK